MDTPPPQPKGMGIRYLLYGLVAVGIVGPVSLIIILLAASAGMAHYASTEGGQRFVEGVKQGYSLAVESTTAPGAQELRDAGCQEAMVTTVAQLTTLVSAFVPEGESEDFDAMTRSEEVLLFCQASMWGATPDCSDLARVYGEAVDPAPAQVVVMVQKQGQNDPACSGYYDPAGLRLGSISAGDFSLVPDEPVEETGGEAGEKAVEETEEEAGEEAGEEAAEEAGEAR